MQTNKKVALAVGGVIVLVVLIMFFYSSGFLPVSFLSLFSNDYQAVFLSNGQVYFGKLYKEKSQYPILRDVFYLQITQPPQPLLEGQTPPNNINLVKLGGELHGPTDEMRINRDHILFVEDLQSDSRVFTAIEQFKEQ